jgi:NADH-quinone oxidoreductase subunit F
MLLDGSAITSLEDYRAAGGLAGLEAAERLGPEGVVEELVASGLRGRGGAGFPAGTKWRSVMAGGPAAGRRFTVANGAEGEPGSFKDRTIIRHNPFALLEGLLIAAWTVGADRAILALKSSFVTEAELIAAAAGELAAAGVAEGISVEIVLGPDEYLFGEEKALLEVIEGEDPLPRLFPPYVYGLFTTEPQLGWSSGATLDSGRTGSNPTLVNNVETLSNVPQILARGADWYRSMGTEESPGTIVCTVSGDTMRHGVAEFEMGTPLSQVLGEVGGGVPDGRAVKYVLSGVANPVIRADHLDTPLTYEHMEAIGSGLGTGGFIVFDDTTDPVELAREVSRFLWVESCGQCPACKLGTGRITEILSGEGPRGGGTFAELSARLENVTDGARCFLPTQEQRLVNSLMADMRVPELRTAERGLLVSKILDLEANRFVLDARQALKQPDWTYAER